MALCLLLWIAIWQWTRVPDFAPISDGARAVAFLRGEISSYDNATPIEGAFVTVWRDGKIVERAKGEGGTVGAALRGVKLHERGRVKIDLVRGRGPILRALLPFVPITDGIAATLDGKQAALLPDELFQDDLLAAPLLRALELDLGIDAVVVEERLATQLGLDWREWKARAPRLERLRIESIVEGASAPKENLREAARAGGRYLLEHLRPDGSFDYEYDPVGDRALGDLRYSLPRHAGAAYFLAQLGETEFTDGARRAIEFLAAQVPPGCDRGERLCVGAADEETVDLGATALALLGATELERATRQEVPEARRWAAFLLAMQKPDGDFCHLHSPREDRRDCSAKLLYYTGEAAFALARHGNTEPAARAVDYLTGPAYSHFAGSFYFGEDHWTCLAADALFDGADGARKKTWGEFCSGFGKFLRRSQHDDGWYGFGPMLSPHTTPAGSRTEAAISILRMERALGLASDDTRAQIARATRFLLSRQLRDENSWRFANPARARGGFLISDARPLVRIDFVQHCGSAMLRASELNLLE